MLVRCPDKWWGDDPGPLYVVGCGHTFNAEPDQEGLVDCPNCGVWFNPEYEIAVEPRGIGGFISEEARAAVRNLSC